MPHTNSKVFNAFIFVVYVIMISVSKIPFRFEKKFSRFFNFLNFV